MKDKDKIIREEIQRDLERLRDEISKIPNAHMLLEEVRDDAAKSRESLKMASASLDEVSRPVGRLAENISYLLRVSEILEGIRNEINEEIRGSSSRTEMSVNTSQEKILEQIVKSHGEIENRFGRLEAQVSKLKKEVVDGIKLLWVVLALEGLLVVGIVIVLVSGG